MENKNTLVELDSLIDTRLAMVYLLDKESATSITKDGSYYKRVKDNYGSISKDIFDVFYKKRNKQLLLLGLPTPVFTILKQHYGDIITDEINDEFEDDIKIFVNIYPYDLLESEKEKIIETVNNIIPKSIVEIVSLSKKELTPVWVHENVSTVIMYEGVEWLEYHMSNDNLINNPLLKTLLISPAIVPGSVSSSSIKKDTFKDLMLVSGTLIDLVLVDAINFSRVK